MGGVGSILQGHRNLKLLMETALGTLNAAFNSFLYQKPFIILSVNLAANLPEFLAAQKRARGSSLPGSEDFLHMLPI